MLDIIAIDYIRCYALLIMNYRLLLTEMLIDYKERRDLTKCGKTYKVYTEVIKDLILALDIEPNLQNQLRQAKDIINCA